MTDRIQTFFTFVSEVMTEPGANLTAAVLLLAAVTTILLLIVVATTFYLLPASKSFSVRASRSRVPGAGNERKRRSAPRRARTPLDARIVWMIGGLMAIALISGYLTSAQDFYCTTCHQEMQPESEEIFYPNSSQASTTSIPAPSVQDTSRGEDQKTDSIHGDARCVSCHERAQFSGALANTLTRVRHVVGWITRTQPRPIPIEADRCLACHDGILDGAVTSLEGRLRMSHIEPIDAGMSCDACHRGIGHVSDPRPDPGMSTCLRCHDGERASSECTSCHIGDIAYAGSERLTFAPVGLPPVTDCGGCHEQTSCDSCHG
ncbi:MAG: hypothetical protein PF636_06905, partial [Actinomycetota bacterium]|nr:hypothetical protein [Actinomycetota bacterium]